MQKAERYPKAVPALQSAIRGAPQDVNIWLQLALAYRGAGKHVAALKALKRVCELDSENWHAGYLIGDVQRQLGLYSASISSFETVLPEAPEGEGAENYREIVLKTAVAETKLLLAHSQIRDGFSSRGAGTLVECVDASLELLAIDGASARIAWKLLSDSLLKLGQLRPQPSTDDSDDDPLHGKAVASQLSAVLEKLAEADVDAKNPVLQGVISTKLLSARIGQLETSLACLCTAVLGYSLRVLLHSGTRAGGGDDGLGCAWYDLGHAIHQLKPHLGALHASPNAIASEVDARAEQRKQKEEECTMTAIQCLRYALQKEPLNGSFWNLLGVIAGPSTPKLGQHALIRACELNVRVSRLPCSTIAGTYADKTETERCPMDQSRTVLPLA